MASDPDANSPNGRLFRSIAAATEQALDAWWKRVRQHVDQGGDVDDLLPEDWTDEQKALARREIAEALADGEGMQE